LALEVGAGELAAQPLNVLFHLRDACAAMPAEPRLSFRPPELTSLQAHRHGLSQALRSAASSLVAAPGHVVPTLALMLAVPLHGSSALASSPAAWAAYDARVRAACRAATTLVGAVERGDRLDLPGPALSVFLLEGRYRQAHLQGQRGLKIPAGGWPTGDGARHTLTPFPLSEGQRDAEVQNLRQRQC